MLSEGAQIPYLDISINQDDSDDIFAILHVLFPAITANSVRFEKCTDGITNKRLPVFNSSLLTNYENSRKVCD